MATVEVQYRGSASATRNVIPVDVGRQTRASTGDLDFEDVERFLSRRYGGEYRLVRVHGFASLKPKSERRGIKFGSGKPGPKVTYPKSRRRVKGRKK